ncbi:MAG: phosphotransferase [Actinoplanes sp.]
MKTLPDNPNLDHLRRQAKDLLAGLRDTRPGAALADAQASLAEQYGFRTWTDLKVAVDRRQGQAEVAAGGLARRIAERFGLGEVTAEMRSLARPDEVGRRWLLVTGRGRWTARTVDGVYPVTDGEQNARFQEAAARAGVTLPAPVRSITGAVTEEIDGHRWRVYASVRSGPPLAAPVSSAITYGVGKVLATLHGLRMPAERLCPWSSTRLGRSTAGLSALQPIGDYVLCHNNLNPGNVRVDASGRLVVTGWEHAAGLPPAWELCAALVAWTTYNGEVNGPGVRALLDGYRDRAGSLPALSLHDFRGTATATSNYVTGLIEQANATADEDDIRSVEHMLSHLPSPALYEQILRAAATPSSR